MPRPLLLGHRGLRLAGEPLENTIAAFDRALELGCDGFEFDVRRTADGQAVIWHDTSYCGCELAAVDSRRVRQLASLEEVLARYLGRTLLDIELKVPGLEATTLAALGRHQSHCDFLVSSFFPEILQAVHARNPGVPLGFICDRQSRLVHWRELPVEYVIAQSSLLKLDMVEDFHNCHKRVMVWTVNHIDEMLRFYEWGVDAIISDDPGLLVRTIGQKS